MAWLIDEGYDVIGFMADVGQEEVRSTLVMQSKTSSFFLRTLTQRAKRHSSVVPKALSWRYVRTTNGLFNRLLLSDLPERCMCITLQERNAELSREGHTRCPEKKHRSCCTLDCNALLGGLWLVSRTVSDTLS